MNCEETNPEGVISTFSQACDEELYNIYLERELFGSRLPGPIPVFDKNDFNEQFDEKKVSGKVDPAPVPEPEEKKEFEKFYKPGEDKLDMEEFNKQFDEEKVDEKVDPAPVPEPDEKKDFENFDKINAEEFNKQFDENPTEPSNPGNGPIPEFDKEDFNKQFEDPNEPKEPRTFPATPAQEEFELNMQPLPTRGEPKINREDFDKQFKKNTAPNAPPGEEFVGKFDPEDFDKQFQNPRTFPPTLDREEFELKTPTAPPATKSFSDTAEFEIPFEKTNEPSAPPQTPRTFPATPSQMEFELNTPSAPPQTSTQRETFFPEEPKLEFNTNSGFYATENRPDGMQGLDKLDIGVFKGIANSGIRQGDKEVGGIYFPEYRRSGQCVQTTDLPGVKVDTCGIEDIVKGDVDNSGEIVWEQNTFKRASNESGIVWYVRPASKIGILYRTIAEEEVKTIYEMVQKNKKSVDFVSVDEKGIWRMFVEYPLKSPNDKKTIEEQINNYAYYESQIQDGKSVAEFQEENDVPENERGVIPVDVFVKSMNNNLIHAKIEYIEY